jgi:hypothetical protein
VRDVARRGAAACDGRGEGGAAVRDARTTGKGGAQGSERESERGGGRRRMVAADPVGNGRERLGFERERGGEKYIYE